MSLLVGMKFNMYEFALMARFIELGKRYGLEPWQFGVEYDRDTGETYFTGSPAGHEESLRFKKLAEAIGCSADGRISHQEGADMIEALDEAIDKAPRVRAR